MSSALALEEAILDMLDAGRSVYIVGAYAQPRDRLERRGILKRPPPENVTEKLTVALKRAIYGNSELSVHEWTSDALSGSVPHARTPT